MIPFYILIPAGFVVFYTFYYVSIEISYRFLDKWILFLEFFIGILKKWSSYNGFISYYIILFGIFYFPFSFFIFFWGFDNFVNY